MNAPLSIGLIGCGRVAERFYLPAISRLLTARLVAVADPLSERRELISSGIYGCMAFTSAEELFERAKIAAVIIATPPQTHVPITKLALNVGIPVLVEKPLALSMDGVEELEALAVSSNSPVMLGFNRRYWAPVCQLRQVLQNQGRSDKLSAQLVMTSNIQDWSPVGEVSDPLSDLGSHQLDLIRYIFDRDILAIGARWEDTSTIHMRVRLEGNVVVECLVAHCNVSQEYITVRSGPRRYHLCMGSERIQQAVGPIRSFLDFSDTLKRRLRNRQSLLRRSHEQQLKRFFYHIRSGTIPQPGIADGIAVIHAVEAARKSVDCGGKEVLIKK